MKGPDWKRCVAWSALARAVRCAQLHARVSTCTEPRVLTERSQASSERHAHGTSFSAVSTEAKDQSRPLRYRPSSESPGRASRHHCSMGSNRAVPAVGTGSSSESASARTSSFDKGSPLTNDKGAAAAATPSRNATTSDSMSIGVAPNPMAQRVSTRASRCASRSSRRARSLASPPKAIATSESAGSGSSRSTTRRQRRHASREPTTQPVEMAASRVSALPSDSPRATSAWAVTGPANRAQSNAAARTSGSCVASRGSNAPPGSTPRNANTSSTRACRPGLRVGMSARSESSMPALGQSATPDSSASGCVVSTRAAITVSAQSRSREARSASAATATSLGTPSLSVGSSRCSAARGPACTNPSRCATSRYSSLSAISARDWSAD
ncbi:putative cell-wall-anchored protein SasA (LPXTG motif) [Myxococcus hansupus]|uniref:Putative cell-wall-anchored protein SasA (LPXTG motif) n=1 Tax=Pseudomyxococcus hansupus TaxID=1297742 RepID=A0A0H4X5H7_9BACT|nr:putative cell-wall-anchored protein SasA (LPXTG motif) [Myxococcus hansupus]